MLKKSVCWTCTKTKFYNYYSSSCAKVKKEIKRTFEQEYKEGFWYCAAKRDFHYSDHKIWVWKNEEPPADCYYRLEQII